MLYLQASYLTNQAKSLINAKKRSKTVEKTLLQTDRFVSLSMVLIPLCLLTFSRFFTPSSTFTVDSMNCAHPFDIHQKNESYWVDYGFDKSRLTFGGHRGYIHNYCWKHAKFGRDSEKNKKSKEKLKIVNRPTHCEFFF